MPNAMLVIHPYKSGGTWVFDDARYGLVREPFVLGASEMIDRIVEREGVADAAKGFTLVFSAQAFPGHHAELVKENAESGGTWYRFADGSMRGWLCPALFHYFPQAPDRIFARAEAGGR